MAATGEGSCRCGAVRIEVSAKPLLTMACHCTGCQKMTGSAYSLSVAIPQEGFAVTQGETVSGGADPVAGHQFCGRCLTWMFTRPAGMPFVNVRPTMFDNAQGYAPFIETFTAEKLAWVVTPAAHSYERFPPIAAYDELLGAYPAWAAAQP